MDTKSSEASLGRDYAIAIALSSFCLFLVQPLISQALLPWFGGGNVVWSTALVFFQMVLLAGYIYAHVLTRFLPKTQLLTHGVLILVALASLPILPSVALRPAPDAEPTSGVLFVLLLSVGLPYFLLSTTTPLLQAWYSRLPRTNSPYTLYALSNAASLLALAVYPFVLQPLFSLPKQSLVFSVVFVATAVALARAASLFIQKQQPKTDQEKPYSLQAKDALVWTGLAAIGSALFLGITNQLTIDIAPTPFLWVLPLAIYLLSFILAFSDPFWYQREFTAGTFAFAVFASLLFSTTGRALPTNIVIIPPMVMLLVGCLLCHGELARRKPNAHGLTWFYLCMSLGGAIGGMFVALLAPKIFTGYWELPIAQALCIGLALAVTIFDRQSKHWIGKQPITGGSACLLASAIGCLFIVSAERFYRDTDLVKRTPYGVLRVKHYNRGQDDEMLELLNGGTTHGNQYLNDNDRGEPTTYYGYSSGVGQLMNTYPYSDALRIGVIGLGAGTMATHINVNDRLTFYEIDPAVEDIARHTFHYLDLAAPSIDVVIGDARLSLAQQEPQQFDVLVIDAFSSDAIPVHLLTQEAFTEYDRHMKHTGVIAVHISNRNLNLQPVVLGIAKDKQYAWRDIRPETLTPHETGSEWILLSYDETRLAQIKTSRDIPGRAILWTDAYSSILPLLRL